MAQNVKIGIVLVNYNGLAFIKECLESLVKIDYLNVRIVVVDNASVDGSFELIARNYPQVKGVRLSNNLGFSGANNEGIRWCVADGCEYVFLLNSDTVVEADFLSKIMDYADSNSLIVPKIYFCDNKKIINNNVGSFDYWRGITIPYFYGEKDSQDSQQVQIVAMASACAILIPCEVFRKIGFLDENYFLYWEDTDFIARAIYQGYLIRFVPQAVIYHKEGGSCGGRTSPLVIYYNNRNRLYFMSKYKKNMVNWIFFLFYYLLGRFGYIILYLCRGQFREFKALSLGVFDFYRGKMGYLTTEGQKGFK